MADIAELGLLIRTDGVAKAEAELDRMAVSATKAEDAVIDLNAASQRMGRGAVGSSQQSRMLAMQLSQVGQQAAATGQFVQALAIQLPDMAMGFGAMGMAIATVASVALPALVSAFSSTGTEAKSLDDAITDLNDSLKAYRAAIDDATYAGLADAFGRVTPQVIELQRQLQELRLREVMLDAADAVNALSSAFSNGGFLTTGAQEMASTFDLSLGQLAQMKHLLRQIGEAETFEDQLRAVDAMQDAILRVTGGIENMTTEQAAFYAKTLEAERALRMAQAAADGVAGSVQNAAGAAANLAANAMGAVDAFNALSRAQAIASGAIEESGSVAGGRGTINPDALDSAAASRGGIYYAYSSKKAKSGGAGGADQYAARLEALQESLQTERETVDAWYEENQKILDDRRAQELLGIQEHNDLKLALEQEYIGRVAEIEAEAYAQRMSDAAGFFGSLADIVSVGGKKTVKVVAAFEAVQGTLNAYGAAIKALNTPGLSLWGRFAAYASVLAAGMKGVAAIRSAGGIGGGSAASSTAAQASTSSGSQSTIYVAGISEDTLLTGAMMKEIFDGVMTEAEKRGGNFRVVYT